MKKIILLLAALLALETALSGCVVVPYDHDHHRDHDEHGDADHDGR